MKLIIKCFVFRLKRTTVSKTFELGKRSDLNMGLIISAGVYCVIWQENILTIFSMYSILHECGSVCFNGHLTLKWGMGENT
jgi:hypothetical protein